ncbi:carbohydrate ABC transporter substrate-binding protein, CUT1 family [Microbacterium testaceum StLB037]|uniref:Carbohydrate ABC transporter substrate-binding protein, CUT1 family n=1 Tax=Microbacterium testaceum (strain StLB037) TaxID=979556 RepID=A0A1H0PZ42_MICTS|nr:extracellular solute-binding protein [Microbacterium testaceum]SDP10457.1 carbohydrate ABC transporter substrate-binding protein, CUT1 family [Microbacterium testaceum StLB037]
MKKSRWSAVAVVAAAAIVLTGCGRTSDTGSGAAEASTIGDAKAQGTLTMWAMGAEGEALPAFVKQFEDANPGVTVEVTPVPWDAAYSKFQTAIAGGNTPDLAMVGSTWMADFGDALQTVPTDLSTDGIFPGAIDSTMIDDRATGVPWYVDTRVLYYRTDIAAQAGWTTPPATWDDLKKMAADMQSKGGADYGIRFPAGNDSFQGNLWMPWSNGAELEDGAKWTLDTPETAEALDYYQSFYTDGIANPAADRSAGAQEADFVSGKTPMLIDGPFLIGQLEELGGAGFSDKFSTAVLPKEESSTSFSGGANLAVFDNSDNAASAWKLVQWLTEPETQAAWYDATGDLPAVQDAWKADALASSATLAAFGTQLETAKSVPAVTTWVQVAAAGDAMLEKIRLGQQTPADGLKELQATADQLGLG